VRPAILVTLLAACAGAPPSPDAPPPIAGDAPVELSGEWNDVDADLVATALIEDFLKSSWIAEWKTRNADRPTPKLRLYPIKNRTTGYIDHRFFTQRFEAAIVRSGKMAVLAAPAGPRSSDGEEDATAEAQAEKEADFVLTGSLIAQDDEGAAKKVTAYLATVEIVETATQRKAWIGQKRIRKIIDK
jgi:hypothetical protein